MRTKLVATAMAFAILSIVGIVPVFATGDFSLTDNPPSCEDYISPTTGCTKIIVTVASVSGFSGTVDLTATVVSGPPNSPLTPNLNPTSVTVPSNGNATSTFTVTASCHQTLYCLWLVNVTGTSGPLSHTLQIAICRGRSCPA